MQSLYTGRGRCFRAILWLSRIGQPQYGWVPRCYLDSHGTAGMLEGNDIGALQILVIMIHAEQHLVEPKGQALDADIEIQTKRNFGFALLKRGTAKSLSEAVCDEDSEANYTVRAWTLEHGLYIKFESPKRALEFGLIDDW